MSWLITNYALARIPVPTAIVRIAIVILTVNANININVTMLFTFNVLLILGQDDNCCMVFSKCFNDFSLSPIHGIPML